jgi:hypothetical protein
MDEGRGGEYNRKLRVGTERAYLNLDTENDIFVFVFLSQSKQSSPSVYRVLDLDRTNSPWVGVFYLLFITFLYFKEDKNIKELIKIVNILIKIMSFK